ncbi:rhodanese-like domain-containing protein [Microbacterium sp. APC 3898]|uniref:Rhodanese-like domain-containing protein n=1 Tax=Planococcus notacanthi TaxID=3035188 RepID=A0ABT7ZKD0_9BACL|nr:MULTISPECIES: rhodanese-like domain-containing protein [Terrabacteria group]MDN3427604.1 rhodanese-like domain-containing protein [Planococcus sp. APC 4016]MDN3499155.1 rhodanese-like domain-containing protein [Microbacterium sp. APC 3898]
MKTMTTQQVRELVESKQTINLIDVRETNEVAAGKIPGAINIPLGLLEFRMNELDKSKEYIMVCRSGGRSGQATNFLENHGYKVTNMDGGMLDWNGETN